MAIDITALYCCLDDFCQVFEAWEAHRLIPSEQTRQRTGKLSRAEMLFIMVLFHLSPFKHFKAFYLYGIGHQHRSCFGDLPHYDRFVSLMPRLFVPLMVLLHSLSGEQTGVYFADATKLAVCHNRRITRHRVFNGLAARGKTSMGEAGQRFRRRSRWNGQMRVVLWPQAALRDQPQRPDHRDEDHPRQHRRQHRAGRDHSAPDGQTLRCTGRPKSPPEAGRNRHSRPVKSPPLGRGELRLTSK
jgi:hypothetical protein